MLIVPSRAEGGANVVTEAAVRGVGILATDVPGNVGLLGAAHAGLFQAGDAAALARLLAACERDPRLRDRIRRTSVDLARFATPARERAAWTTLCKEVACISAAALPPHSGS